MEIARLIVLALIGMYCGMELFSVFAVGKTAFHQIYGGIMLACIIMCIGFAGGRK